MVHMAEESATQTNHDTGVLQLKVGKITTISEHPNAEKLYIETIDVGEAQPRQIISGLKDHYSADALEGKQVIVVTNLQPAKLRGERSEGMILAVEDEHKTVGLLSTDAPVGSTLFTEQQWMDNAEQITIKEFAEVTLAYGDEGATIDGERLFVDGGTLFVDKDIQGTIR